MKEVFENIKEKIKNQPIEQFVDTNGNWDLVQTVLDCCCEAVDRVKEEYNNGWIPCSERLPDKEGEYLVTLRRWNCVTFANFKDIKNNPHFDTNYVTAWQPLPQTYQPKGE